MYCIKLKSLKLESGASLVEYVLLVSLIAVIAITAVRFLGESNKESLDKSKLCIEASMNGLPLPAECPQ